MLVLSLAEIGAMVMEKKMKKKDGHIRTDGQPTSGYPKSSLELSVKVSSKVMRYISLYITAKWIGKKSIYIHVYVIFHGVNRTDCYVLFHDHL